MPKLPDPRENPDYVIAEAAEEYMRPIKDIAGDLGITDDELLLHGHYVAKVDFKKLLERLKDRPDGKYIDVTAITPTPLGEGKSTSSMGLVEGLGKRGVNVTAAIRQPSGGPTMNIKGSAAGGGLAQCIPLTPFSLGLTGDINAIMNAHNLAMVAMNSRMQHERNYNDEQADAPERHGPPGHRPHQHRDGLDHRLLLPGPQEHRHGPGRAAPTASPCSPSSASR